MDDREADPPPRRHERFHGRVPGAAEACAHPGCGEPGEFRAPRRDGLARADRPDWRWLCLEHVREFNAGYNYFSGMTPAEIEAAQTPYGGWERETRAFAANAAADPAWARFTDPADVLGARFRRGGDEAAARQNGHIVTSEDRRALEVLGLALPATRSAIRRAYAERVRRFHPDRNGGDRSHERALRAVIGAYTHLRKAPAFL